MNKQEQKKAKKMKDLFERTREEGQYEDAIELVKKEPFLTFEDKALIIFSMGVLQGRHEVINTINKDESKKDG